MVDRISLSAFSKGLSNSETTLQVTTSALPNATCFILLEAVGVLVVSFPKYKANADGVTEPLVARIII